MTKLKVTKPAMEDRILAGNSPSFSLNDRDWDVHHEQNVAEVGDQERMQAQMLNYKARTNPYDSNDNNQE